MKAKKLLAGLGTVALCAGLYIIPGCGNTNTSGGDDDNNMAGNNASNNASNNATNNDDGNNDPANNDDDNNDPDPCADCTADQTCVNDECVDNNVCENAGDTCDEMTMSTDALICFNGDNTTPQELTCHVTCTDTENSADCPSGSFCVGLQDNMGNPVGNVCIESNCSGYFSSEADCADASANGGTCVESDNDSFYCQEAGTLAAGEPCTGQDECGVDLFCFFGSCQPLCTLSNEDEPCPEGLGCVDLLESDTAGICGDDCAGFEATEDDCEEGFGCLPITTDTGVCTETGDIAVDEACDPELEEAQCEALSSCVSITDAIDPTCQPLCDLTAEDPNAACGEGEVCIVAFAISDTTGVCVAGCDPSSDTNECEAYEGAETCLPQGPGTGLCIDSGDKAPGDVCALVDGGVFGDCGMNSACLPDDFENEADDAPGVCEEICQTFSSTGDFESGCPDGEVCEIFGTEWGLCTTNVIDPPLGPYEACTSPGDWCSDDNICLEIDANGNAICIPLCRFGGDDCSGITSPQGDPTACDELFASDSLGACLPQQ